MKRARAFTLVEILIVVVILGILAAIIVPNFATATQEAQSTTTFSELGKLRRAMEVFGIRNPGTMPNVIEGDGVADDAWGELVQPGEYLQGPPANPWVGGDNRYYVIIRNSPDVAYQNTYAWIYDDTSGDIWAGGFDGNDQPIPRP